MVALAIHTKYTFALFVIVSFGNFINVDGQSQCTNVTRIQRLDCHPEVNANAGDCIYRGCCWYTQNTQDDIGIPACYFPIGYPSYYVESSVKTSRGYMMDLMKPPTKYSDSEFKKIRLETIKETKSRLRFRFTVPSQPNRWEPPIPLGKPNEQSPDVTDYDVHIEKNPFGIKVLRNSQPNTVLIDSTGLMAPSLILSDQFLQITFRLTAQHAYGPGELETQFPHAMDKWLRSGLWNHDGEPMKDVNLYGTQNFILGQYYDGTAFGLFFLNSNAQEVAWTPLPSITYRTIGGIMDFFLFTGPKPADVIAQYYDLIGHPMLPPYWSLGFQLCRYGAKDVAYVKKVLKRNRDANIPLDGQWFDIDYMDAYKDWTVDPINYGTLGDFIRNDIHKQYGMKAVTIVDPAISTQGGPAYHPYHSGLLMGIYVNSSVTKQPIVGVVWPGKTVFPDFSHPNVQTWWYQCASEFHKIIPFDGLWIDMNEPSNFVAGSLTGCPGWNKLDYPPFTPSIIAHSLPEKTLCPSALHYDTTHYNRHNLYGHDEALVTQGVLKQMFPDKRPFVLSRSTFAGSGRYTAHWTGDVLSAWRSLRITITQLINFNIFAIPFIGADICGFNGDTTQELCVRWSQLGAFYPFCRNHNTINARDQDPAAWSSKATAAIRDALQLRYHLLPYIYSLFFRAHLNGSTVARALSFEFPKDLGTHTIKEQYMLGSCLLITPVLYEGRTGVAGYVPPGDWINLSNGERISSCGQWVYFQAPMNVIPILVRGGCILPMQKSANTTSFARKDGFNIVVVLSQPDDGSSHGSSVATAQGEVFWDNGEETNMTYLYAKFTVQDRILTVTPQPVGSNCMNKIDPIELKLNTVMVIGVTKQPASLLLNGESISFNFEDKKQLLSANMPPSINIGHQFQIQWKFE